MRCPPSPQNHQILILRRMKIGIFCYIKSKKVKNCLVWMLEFLYETFFSFHKKNKAFLKTLWSPLTKHLIPPLFSFVYKKKRLKNNTLFFKCAFGALVTAKTFFFLWRRDYNTMKNTFFKRVGSGSAKSPKTNLTKKIFWGGGEVLSFLCWYIY